MRMMLKITLPTEVANRAIEDGSFQRVLDETMTKILPEASYFVADKGCRCAMLFFDLTNSSDIPGIVEPLFKSLNANVELQPAMNSNDLRTGMSAMMQTK